MKVVTSCHHFYDPWITTMSKNNLYFCFDDIQWKVWPHFNDQPFPQDHLTVHLTQQTLLSLVIFQNLDCCLVTFVETVDFTERSHSLMASYLHRWSLRLLLSSCTSDWATDMAHYSSGELSLCWFSFFMIFPCGFKTGYFKWTRFDGNSNFQNLPLKQNHCFLSRRLLHSAICTVRISCMGT